MRTVMHDGHEWQVLREVRLEDGTVVLNLVRQDGAARFFWSAKAAECEPIGQPAADVRQADTSKD